MNICSRVACILHFEFAIQSIHYKGIHAFEGYFEMKNEKLIKIKSNNFK